MSNVTLAAQTRMVKGKKVKNLRRDGLVPIVVYGRDLNEALSLQVGNKDLQKVLYQAGRSSVIEMKVDGRKSHLVLARTVDRHPTRNNILHADFLAINLNRPVQAVIPIRLIGESALAASNAAVLRQVLEEINVEGLPNALPDAVSVDITPLERIGQTIAVGDVKLGDGLKIITDHKAQIARLNAPQRLAEEEEGEGEGEGEGEVEVGAEAKSE